MKKSTYVGFIRIAEGSFNNNNSAQIPQIATKRIYFRNDEEQAFSITDLDLKKIRRSKKIEKLKSTYIRLFKENKVSVWLFIADAEKQETPSKFIQGLKTKFKRKGVEILGYYWQRDIGDNEFKLHYHIIIITSFLHKDKVVEIFKSNKTNADFKFVFCKYLNSFKEYLVKKEMYGCKNKKTWGCSIKFKKPNKSI